jgi:hypothetical protein
MIDKTEAAAALDDIAQIAQRVRQSLFYRVSSSVLMLWGVLVFGGYMVSFLAPRYAGATWIGIYVVGFAGTTALGGFHHVAGTKSFDWRIAGTFILYVGFGYLMSFGMFHLLPRQLSAFWPTYIMLAYSIAGLWLGPAFLVIGIATTALTVIGYFYVGPWFDLYMAFVNGVGLIIAGAWMRRG